MVSVQYSTSIRQIPRHRMENDAEYVRIIEAGSRRDQSSHARYLGNLFLPIQSGGGQSNRNLINTQGHLNDNLSAWQSRSLQKSFKLNITSIYIRLHTLSYSFVCLDIINAPIILNRAHIFQLCC